MATQAAMFGGGEVFSKVEVSVSCQNLKDLDYFSKSDPCVFLYEQVPRKGWSKLGRTEVIDNDLNPRFSKTFLLYYRFEEIQKLKFTVVDVDDRSRVDDISRHDLIGELECTLADLVTAGQQYERTLRLKGESRGKIRLQAEEVLDSKYLISLQLSATKLDKKDFFGKSDPFVEIAKAQEGGAFTVVYRSKPILKTLDPKWPKFQLPIQKLCSGDWERSIRFTVWDWNKSGDHDFIGSGTTTLKDITPEKGGQVFNMDLVNPELKKKKKKYTNSGVLNFVSVQASQLNTFTDYIRGGCQISLMVAIDFTASNGRPDDSRSLHYMGSQQENEYMQAIRSVASVLAPYDSDQMIPVYGFGARLPPDGSVSHCFPLNFNHEKPEVYGVQGIIDVYRYAISQVQLFGPTNFSSFMDKAIEISVGTTTQESQNYFILLVITDGVITDMANTVDRIVDASNLPLSIVIVGVGAADFSNMEVLDADETPLKNRRGDVMKRDIVQFVPFRELQSTGGANFSLARETLAEIPGQLTSFMKVNNIRPNPPPLRHQRSSLRAPGNVPPSYGQPGVGAGAATAPYPSGPAPYPTGATSGPAPYPTGQAPYPTGPTSGPPPYPTGQASGPAPYPTGQVSGQAPYPTGPAPNQGPYSQQTAGHPPTSAPPPYPI